MKYIITLSLILTFNYCVAQNKVVRYCEIHIMESGFSRNNISAEVVPGKIDSLTFFNDKSKMYKISRLNTRTDVLNFMSSEGWLLFSITSNTIRNESVFQRFFFYKEFYSSALPGTNKP
ncbi:hypothetical protein [Mucilaginibacter psychrotolerans]|uniref:Uncharacterized protein n=1 Tax=Mucilaginibacter psychrotolerans TaxID=1524096 RepID=A0A4Y8S4T0_9SPHI|nr:hypothetical protein [Mucilaginibacter psychrotolerans]TFF33570.1 hypothetical protein E2R66_25175 [Mucilaginibacter psychrotolerans]